MAFVWIIISPSYLSSIRTQTLSEIFDKWTSLRKRNKHGNNDLNIFLKIQQAFLLLVTMQTQLYHCIINDYMVRSHKYYQNIWNNYCYIFNSYKDKHLFEFWTVVSVQLTFTCQISVSSSWNHQKANLGKRKYHPRPKIQLPVLNLKQKRLRQYRYRDSSQSGFPWKHLIGHVRSQAGD